MVRKNHLAKIKAEFEARTDGSYSYWPGHKIAVDQYQGPECPDRVYRELVSKYGGDAVQQAMGEPDLSEGAESPPPF